LWIAGGGFTEAEPIGYKQYVNAYLPNSIPKWTISM
jgi:hypothetical protein